MRLTAAEIEDARRIPGTSALVFLTDRCPVGCAHCSVDSSRDSPRITDFALLDELIAGLVWMHGTRVVGVSGGEPFIERRGLTTTVRALAGAGKQVVIYTSGMWAANADVPRWTGEVLALASCVYLSTDAYHASRLEDATFVRAARAIHAAGPWIVTQVAGPAAQAARAESLLSAALGPAWREHAEVRSVRLLTAGRGAGLSRGSHAPVQPGADFGKCLLAAAPVIRYDGWVSACCNETVAMGGGPGRLRRRVSTRTELAAALTAFATDHYLRAIGTAGMGALTALPTYQDLSARPFPHICQLCFQMCTRQPSAGDQAILTLLGQRSPR
jgi:organic radical activating enzyme